MAKLGFRWAEPGEAAGVAVCRPCAFMLELTCKIQDGRSNRYVSHAAHVL